ncbi:MAG: hypothetical protein FJX57_20560, partial [Alphaproteobacteria bacterium]|nr:hypothetical protein [Alphaproteobacteria bacterium]
MRTTAGTAVKRSLLILTTGWLLWSPAVPVRAAGGARAVPQPAAAARQRALLDQYCVTCHNKQLNTGNLALDAVDVARAGVEPLVWERVIRKLRLSAMPPPGRPRPDAAETQAFVAYLKAEIDQAAS